MEYLIPSVLYVRQLPLREPTRAPYNNNNNNEQRRTLKQETKHTYEACQVSIPESSCQAMESQIEESPELLPVEKKNNNKKTN